MDLSAVVPCCSGPKRPQDRIAVSDMKSDFDSCLAAKVRIPTSPFPLIVPGSKMAIVTKSNVCIRAILGVSLDIFSSL